jgi:hypothetical protein
LSASLSQTKRIQSLTLSWFELNDDDVRSIAEGLQCGRCFDLQELYLTSNDIQSQGFIHLFRLLEQCPQMRKLDFQYSDTDWTEASFKLIGKLVSLHELDLGGNYFSDWEFGWLVQALPNLVNLRTLGLHAAPRSESGFSEVAACQLLDIIPSLPHLNFVSLGYQSLVSRNVLKKIKAAIARNLQASNL